MRKRFRVTPRLETMEDRVVPSFLGINAPNWLTTDLHKMGSAIDGYATHTKNYIKSLNEGAPVSR